jgi:hypothetical protein
VTGLPGADPVVAPAGAAGNGLRYVELNGHNAPRYSRDPRRTVLVIQPRVQIGTVPGVLRSLGFFMGRGLTQHGEDWAFCIRPQSGSGYRDWASNRMLVEHLEDTVLHRNRTHQLWGLKCPAGWPYLGRVAKLAHHSYFVFAVGDVLDYARVAGQYTGQVRQHVLVERLKECSRTLSHLDRHGYPALVYDAHSAGQHPDALLERLCDLLGLQPSEAQLAHARTLLYHPPGSGPAGQSSITGFVDSVDARSVVGWACASNDPERPVEVCLLLDGETAATERACLPRPDVRDAGRHPTGRCGYEFLLAEDRPIRVGQEVRVVECLQGEDLAKSGILFRPGLWEHIPYTSPDGQGPSGLGGRARALVRRITSLAGRRG